jgi:hypothetical protein
MTVQGTWELAIGLRDGSMRRHRERRERAPQVNEVVEINDGLGQVVRVRIDRFSHLPPRDAGLGTWRIFATEV